MDENKNNEVDLALHEAGHLVFGLCDIYGKIESLFPTKIWINKFEEAGKVCNFTWFPNGYYNNQDVPLLKYKKEACKTIGGRIAETFLNNRNLPNFSNRKDEDEDSISDIVKFNQLIVKIVKLETGISVNEDNKELRIKYEQEIWGDCIDYLKINKNVQDAIKHVANELQMNNFIEGENLKTLIIDVNKLLDN
ncbi:MAG: hypothetical protein IPH61_14440 [Bacteroidetes bacterium]|nr:hypothetical protein [Bacteroidota bacterium]MBK8680388.1 hypothetical protein [Bacteroidota bacterium]